MPLNLTLEKKNNKNIKFCVSPCLLIMAPSVSNLKTLGFSFPGCGKGVTDPISTKPNPMSFSDSTASPCLSKPAAIPIGLLKFNPQT